MRVRRRLTLTSAAIIIINKLFARSSRTASARQRPGPHDSCGRWYYQMIELTNN